MSKLWILLSVVAQLFLMALFFMKHSSPALIRTEPQGHDEKKKRYNKTCCNGNMPALPLSDDM